MLHMMTDDGHLGWTCASCGARNRAHITHEELVVTLLPGSPQHRRTVRLPACACGGQTFLKIDFDEEELAEPVVHRDSRGQIVQVDIRGPLNLTRVIDHYEPVPGGGRPRRVIDRVERHPAIAHHQRLAAQLEKAGKARPARA